MHEHCGLARRRRLKTSGNEEVVRRQDTQLPYTALQAALDERFPFNANYWDKGVFIDWDPEELECRARDRGCGCETLGPDAGICLEATSETRIAATFRVSLIAPPWSRDVNPRRLAPHGSDDRLKATLN